MRNFNVGKICAFRRRVGMALVVTLSILVLVSVAVLAFYAQVTANQRIESSRANQVKADLLAKSAADRVIAGFLEEITASSTNMVVNNVTVFNPNQATNLAARRVLAGGVPSTSDDFASLIRQSVPGTDTSASSENTATVGKSGRVVGTNRWNAPALLAGNGFDATNQLPNWVYVTRDGPTNASSTNVIGRFAYNVYDIGGLLDVCAAGHPGSATASELKRTVAGADLSALGLSSASVQKLVENFRNPGGGDYSNRVEVLVGKGFLAQVVTNASGVKYTNNFPVNRQDLLRFARTQSPGMTNALPYLTVFSRSLNAPVWGPLTNGSTGYKYLTDANKDGTTTSPVMNRFLPHVRFTSAATVTHYDDDGNPQSRDVKAGDPLIARKFSLGKLAWLTHTGPKAGITDEAIKAAFGLEWNPATAGWKYTEGITRAGQLGIRTLKEVATVGREPNFFELLQAGILKGALGKTGSPLSALAGDEGNAAYQIIRIGANIIDQGDADSYPTSVTFDDFAFWGIEDLPYFYKLFRVIYWPKGPTTAPPAPYKGAVNPENPPSYNYLIYELWNPHQTSVTSASPTDFRVRIGEDATYLIEYGSANEVDPISGSSQVKIFGATPINFRDDPDTRNADLVFTSSGTDYRTPRMIYTGAAPRTLMDEGFQFKAEPPLNQVVDYDVVKLKTSLSVTPSYYFPNAGPTSKFVLNNSAFVLEYRDENNTWRPYSTFIGHEEFGGVSANLGGVGGLPDLRSHARKSLGGMLKPDPRTHRFAGSYGGGYAASAEMWTSIVAATPDGTVGNPPLGKSSNYHIANLSLNDYTDADGFSREADYKSTTKYPYSDDLAPSTSPRPKILNRPFRTVGELGHAFRDVPYKSLDVSTALSGDAALLDLFTVTEEPEAIAGRVNLNSAPAPVLQSLLKGASGVTTSDASAVATNLRAYIRNPDGSLSANAPRSSAELTKFLSTQGNFGTANLKSEREAIVAAFCDTVQTRTWNLLIDVVAQVGKVPAADSSFRVEGEKRYWVSVAIDLYTGEIIDQQWELVNE